MGSGPRDGSGRFTMRFVSLSVRRRSGVLLPLALTMPPSKVRLQCVKLCTNKAANVSFEPKEEAEHTPIIIGA